MLHLVLFMLFTFSNINLQAFNFSASSVELLHVRFFGVTNEDENIADDALLLSSALAFLEIRTALSFWFF